MSAPTFGQASADAIAAQLRGAGVLLDFGAARVRVLSDLAGLAADLARVYPHETLRPASGWADFEVRIHRPRGLRRWARPQALFGCDLGHPFEPFPARHALPLLEWGTNWLIGQHLHHLLLLHAAVVERDGCTLVMPASPGSGKSTLAAALACRGWRLLSDEFGAWDTARGAFVPMLKAVALKNASIDVIRAFAPEASIGPAFPGTRKGTVAHLAPPAEATARRGEPAAPGAVVFPRWSPGAATTLTPVSPATLFSALAFNAFNYKVLGEDGFDAVVALATRCPGWQLVYSDLDDAIRALGALWPPVAAAA